MLRNSLVPNDHSPRLVSYTTAEVMAPIYMVKEKLEQIIRFLIIPADNALGVRRIDEERFLFCHWVDDHDGVDRAGDSTAKHCRIAIISNLTHDWICGGVNCFQAFEAFAEGGGKAFVGTGHLCLITLMRVSKLVIGGGLTLEIIVSPPAPGGDSSIQKKVAPGG